MGKKPEQIYFSKSNTVEGARLPVFESSWGSEKKKFAFGALLRKVDYGAMLIIACKEKKVLGIRVADLNKPDKILIVKKGESEIIATYSLKQIKRIAELEKTDKWVMHHIFNIQDRWKRLKEIKIGVEFTDGKWATIVINFKMGRNKKIKAGKLLMEAAAGSRSKAPF